MKAETMASGNITRALTDPSPQLQKVRKQGRRATTIGWIPEGRQETLSHSAQLTDPSPQLLKVMKQGRRATMTSWTPVGAHETLIHSARRKQSVDNSHRVLFPKTSRLSEIYSGVFS